MNEAPKPGIYENIPFEEYIRWPAVSSSRLKWMSVSPAHYRRPPRSESRALNFGRLAHCGKLEASALPLRYVVMPPFELDYDNVTAPKKKGAYPEQSTSKATAYYKAKRAEFEREAREAGRDVVEAATYAELEDLLSALESNVRAVEYLNSFGRCELSYIWVDPETGLMCKARADKVSDDGITDLKTTEDAGEFENAIWRFGYHRQAAFYQDGWRELTGNELPFRIVAVSKSKPIAVRSAPIHPSSIGIGRLQNCADLQRVAECEASGEWPNHNDPEWWTIPERRADEVMESQMVEFDA